MFIKLYRDVMINYDNNTHLVFDSEAKFLQYLESQHDLVETIDNEKAQNFIPNGKVFTLSLSNMANAGLINYIIWFTGSVYKHFRVVSIEIYSNYVVYRCESDLWADSTYNSDFKFSKIRLTRSNMTYLDNNETVPYYYDTINYTNKKFSQYNFGASTAGNISGNKTYVVAFDRQVDSWGISSLLFGTTWYSIMAVFLESDLEKVLTAISVEGGDKVRVKAIYILPFRPATHGTLELHYKDQPSETQFYVMPVYDNVYYTIKEIDSSVYNNGNKKVYVGAGDSMMLINNIAPKSNIEYRFIIDQYSIKAYVSQGDNSKDITDAYTLKCTSNDSLQSEQEALSKITSAGFKAVSGALMLGSPATMVGGVASITGAGLDLLPSSKVASYTLDGNARSTFITINDTGFNYRVYEAINDMTSITELYGVNYNYYTNINTAISGNFISIATRIYIKADVLELNEMNVEQYNYVKAEIERGIYIKEPIVQLT